MSALEVVPIGDWEKLELAAKSIFRSPRSVTQRITGRGPFLTFFTGNGSKRGQLCHCICIHNWSLGLNPTGNCFVLTHTHTEDKISIEFQTKDDQNAFEEYFNKQMIWLGEFVSSDWKFGEPENRFFEYVRESIKSRDHLGTVQATVTNLGGQRRLQLTEIKTVNDTQVTGEVWDVSLRSGTYVQPRVNQGQLSVIAVEGRVTHRLDLKANKLADLMTWVLRLHYEIANFHSYSRKRAYSDQLTIQSENLEPSNENRPEEEAEEEKQQEPVPQMVVNPGPPCDLTARKEEVWKSAEARKGIQYKPDFARVMTTSTGNGRIIEEHVNLEDLQAGILAAIDDTPMSAPCEWKPIPNYEIASAYGTRAFVSLFKDTSLPLDWISECDKSDFRQHPFITALIPVMDSLVSNSPGVDDNLALMFRVLLLNGMVEGQSLQKLVHRVLSDSGGTDTKELKPKELVRKLMTDHTMFKVLRRANNNKILDEFYTPTALMRLNMVHGSLSPHEKLLSTRRFEFKGNEGDTIKDQVSRFFERPGCPWRVIDELSDPMCNPVEVIRAQIEVGRKKIFGLGKDNLVSELRKQSDAPPEWRELGENKKDCTLEKLIQLGLQNGKMHLWFCYIAYYAQTNSEVRKLFESEKSEEKIDEITVLSKAQVKYVALKIRDYERRAKRTGQGWNQ